MRQLLHCCGMLSILLALGCSLFVEYFMDQVPCSLCLLQRAAMLGIAIGLYFIFRYGLKLYYYGGCLLWSLFGLSCALRQLAINACKDPSTYPFFFMSYRMYTWSFLGFFASIFGISLLIMFYKPFKTKAPVSLVVASFSALSIFLILCAISAFLK
jgi:disulfide bond formation protein DsbB